MIAMANRICNSPRPSQSLRDVPPRFNAAFDFATNRGWREDPADEEKRRRLISRRAAFALRLAVGYGLNDCRAVVPNCSAAEKITLLRVLNDWGQSVCDLRLKRS